MTKNQVRGGGGREHDPVFPDAGLGINRGDAAIERLAGHSNLNDQKSGRGMGMSEIFVRPGDDRHIGPRLGFPQRDQGPG